MVEKLTFRVETTLSGPVKQLTLVYDTSVWERVICTVGNINMSVEEIVRKYATVGNYKLNWQRNATQKFTVADYAMCQIMIIFCRQKS